MSSNKNTRGSANDDSKYKWRAAPPKKSSAKKPVKMVPDACSKCGEVEGKKRDEGLICDDCWIEEQEEPEEESESEEPESPEPDTGACFKCGKKDGTQNVGYDDFICYKCWNSDQMQIYVIKHSVPESDTEPEPEVKPKLSQKRKKDLEEEETKRYKKKMGELGMEPVEWKEHDMVKVDADGDFTSNDREKTEKFREQFVELYKEQRDLLLEYPKPLSDAFFDLEESNPTQAEAVQFHLMHAFAKAANLASNYVVNALIGGFEQSLGYKLSVKKQF